VLRLYFFGVITDLSAVAVRKVSSAKEKIRTIKQMIKDGIVVVPTLDELYRELEEEEVLSRLSLSLTLWCLSHV
jgi:predicted nucleic acid-binding protein